MLKKHISQRKSELRLNIEDFCVGIAENSDPVVAYLLTILEWEASLYVETGSILHKAFVNQIEELKCKLRMQLKFIKHKAEGMDSHSNNITKLVNDFHKLKQVFSYCLVLSKKKSDLCEELQKFSQYEPKEYNLTEELENCLNEPVIFETIFHSYLRIYNVNILTADLISFLYAKHQENSVEDADEPVENVRKWLNQDIELLRDRSIIFKELTDMNKKYCAQEQKLGNSYIYYLCHDMFSALGFDDTEEVQVKVEQDGNLKGRLKKLEQVIGKIKKNRNLYASTQKSSMVVMESEPLSNLGCLEIKNNFPGWKVKEQNKNFFLETLYGRSSSQLMVGDEQFTFLKEKIIKVETLFYLNRILASLNVISYIYNQLDLQMKDNYAFEFKSLRKLIGSEFVNKQMYEAKLTAQVQWPAFVSVDAATQSYQVLDAANAKMLFPSAINYFFCFIKNMLSTGFDDKDGIMQVLQNKSEYVESLAETLINIFEIIKAKQLSCYKLLREYIEIILRSSCWNRIGEYTSTRDLVVEVTREKDKIGTISQIIYEFDHNYSIREPLEELIKIEFDGLTRNCQSTCSLYKSILEEIIQIRNGLKLDHFYSINQIHEIFSLLPTDFDKTATGANAKHQNLYFEDIIHEICTASHHNLFLPRLFFFLDLQLKFKRVVFKLELCWSCNKESFFDRKAQAFKQFISTHCSPIFDLVSECHTIVDILEKIDEIERYIEIFSREVSRLHLIDKIVNVLGCYNTLLPASVLREHVGRLGLDKLAELNTLISIFNPVEAHCSSNRAALMEGLAKNISFFSAGRSEDIKVSSPVYLKQREKLASVLTLINLVSSRNEPADFANFVRLRNNKEISYDIFQKKQAELVREQYEQSLEGPNLQCLIRYHEELFVVSILNTLSEMEAEGLQSQIDYKHLEKLMERFELHSVFKSLKGLTEIQFWRDEFGIMTKYHQIYQLMFSFNNFSFKMSGASRKAQYKQKRLLNLMDHRVDFNYESSDFMTTIYYIFQISPLARMRLQKNIQSLQLKVLELQSAHRKPVYYYGKLKNEIYLMFCKKVQKKLSTIGLGKELGFSADGSRNPNQYVDQLRKIMLKSVTKQYNNEIRLEGYGKIREIEMFKQKKGYELPIIEQKESKDYKIGTKKYIERNKKLMMSPNRLEDENAKPLEEFKRSYKVQILKKSIKLRKQISKLQLSENRIRDEIIWETSKLEHSVVEKINQFITLSNVDQQQSYTNFKHTVNLETMKGIENVIEEQTEMYMEKKNAPPTLEGEPENAFITDVTDPEPKQEIEEKASLLNANVDSILLHMKKIRLFSAWKKTMKKTDLTHKEWCNFNMNVQDILNNNKVAQLVGQIEAARNNYLKQNVTCEIIREENSRVNQKIQELKIDHLQKKVKNYRETLLRS